MPIDLNRVKSQLAAAKVRETDFALFQVINQLIDILRANSLEVSTAATSTGGSVTGLLTKTYLTVNDETAVLISSRQLLAGTNISFDDSVTGERTANVPDVVIPEWSVLSDGDLTEPELVFAGGDVIMVHIP